MKIYMMVIGAVASACFVLLLYLIMPNFSIYWDGYGSELPWLTKIIRNFFFYLVIFPAGFTLMLWKHNDTISLRVWYRVTFWILAILFVSAVFLVYFGMGLPGYYGNINRGQTTVFLLACLVART